MAKDRRTAAANAAWSTATASFPVVGWMGWGIDQSVSGVNRSGSCRSRAWIAPACIAINGKIRCVGLLAHSGRRTMCDEGREEVCLGPWIGRAARSINHRPHQQQQSCSTTRNDLLGESCCYRAPPHHRRSTAALLSTADGYHKAYLLSRPPWASKQRQRRWHRSAWADAAANRHSNGRQRTD